MSDPLRMLDDPKTGAELRQLLSAGQEEVLGAGASTRILDGVEERAGASTAGQGSIALKVAGGLAVLGVIVALLIGRPDEPEPVAAAIPDTDAATEVVSVPPPATLPDVAPEPEPAEPLVQPPLAVDSADTQGASHERPATAKSEAEEAKLLLSARRALASDPAKALSMANKHRRQFRSGVLVEERELLAVRALVALDRSDDARRRAKRFVSKYPTSTHRAAVEKAIRSLSSSP